MRRDMVQAAIEKIAECIASQLSIVELAVWLEAMILRDRIEPGMRVPLWDCLVRLGLDRVPPLRVPTFDELAQIAGQPGLWCANCDRITYDPTDVAHGFCHRCYSWPGMAPFPTRRTDR